MVRNSRTLDLKVRLKVAVSIRTFASIGGSTSPQDFPAAVPAWIAMPAAMELEMKFNIEDPRPLKSEPPRWLPITRFGCERVSVCTWQPSSRRLLSLPEVASGRFFSRKNTAQLSEHGWHIRGTEVLPIRQR